jgi:hypothetical protein
VIENDGERFSPHRTFTRLLSAALPYPAKANSRDVGARDILYPFGLPKRRDYGPLHWRKQVFRKGLEKLSQAVSSQWN